MIRLLFLLIPFTASAQWTLTADSMVHAPYNEVKEAAVERLNVDTIADQLFTEVQKRTEAQQATNQALSECDSAKVAAWDLNVRFGHDLELCQQDATKYEAQAKRRGRTIWTLAVLFLGSVTLHLAR